MHGLARLRISAQRAPGAADRAASPAIMAAPLSATFGDYKPLTTERQKNPEPANWLPRHADNIQVGVTAKWIKSMEDRRHVAWER